MKLHTTHKEYRIFVDSSAESGNTFYCRMGRFFADRGIAKELEEAIYDSPTSQWVIAVDEAGEVCGFGCLDTERLEKAGEALVTYGYVLPEHRGEGLHRCLFQARLELAGSLGAKVVRGVANANSRRMFEESGFEVARQRGRFTHFRKELEAELEAV